MCLMDCKAWSKAVLFSLIKSFSISVLELYICTLLLSAPPSFIDVHLEVTFFFFSSENQDTFTSFSFFSLSLSFFFYFYIDGYERKTRKFSLSRDISRDKGLRIWIIPGKTGRLERLLWISRHFVGYHYMITSTPTAFTFL